MSHTKDYYLDYLAKPLERKGAPAKRTTWALVLDLADEYTPAQLMRMWNHLDGMYPTPEQGLLCVAHAIDLVSREERAAS